MPSRFGEEIPMEEIDLTKRYDIYVGEIGRRIVVYRKAVFRAMRGLQRQGRYDLYSEFYEIEQANGDVVFIRRHDVLKFNEPGTKLVEEIIFPTSAE